MQVELSNTSAICIQGVVPIPSWDVMDDMMEGVMEDMDGVMEEVDDEDGGNGVVVRLDSCVECAVGHAWDEG